VIMSLVFNQLSNNLHIDDPSKWWTFIYNGKPFTDVRSFLEEVLASSGPTSLYTYLTKRIAAFYGLYLRTPTGQGLEVADPLMVNTGIYSIYGTEEAILPAIHSEFVIDVVTDKGKSFNVVWYQGDDGIGFFPGNMYVLESWVGLGQGPNITGQDAIEAIQYMSVLTDVLLQSAEVNGLGLWGYGTTGVCDDVCGALEIITSGASTEYPNQIIKALVIPQILERLEQQNAFSHYYYTLLELVSKLPVDWNVSKDSTAAFRANGTIVWPVGQEPFQCVVDARKILEEQQQQQQQQQHGSPIITDRRAEAPL